MVTVQDGYYGLDLRPWQKRFVEAGRDALSSGRKVMAAYAAPGNGKTRAADFLAWDAIVNDQIDVFIKFTPRVTLCAQAEMDWSGSTDPGIEKPGLVNMLPDHGIGRLNHLGNVAPLFPRDDRGRPAAGLVITYQGLVSDFRRVRKGRDANGLQGFGKEDVELLIQAIDGKRFMVIADECQYLNELVGAENVADREKGLMAVRAMERLNSHEGMTLFVAMTGTSQPATGRRFYVAGDDDRYYARSDDGIVTYTPDVRADYMEGVREASLRRIELVMTDWAGSTKTLLNASVAVNQDLSEWEWEDAPWLISELEEGLRPVMQMAEVWQPMLDHGMERFEIKRGNWSQYQALAVYTDKRHCDQGLNYAKQRFPQFDHVMARSGDDDPHGVLKAFQAGKGDVLHAVRMPYIGFDAPRISTLIMMSHIRSVDGLEQTGGRAWRMCYLTGAPSVDEQFTDIIGAPDVRFREMFERLRDAGDLAWHERIIGIRGDKLPSESKVRRYEVTDRLETSLMATDRLLDVSGHALFRAEEIHRTVAPTVPPSVIAAIGRMYGGESAGAGAGIATEAPARESRTSGNVSRGGYREMRVIASDPVHRKVKEANALLVKAGLVSEEFGNREAYNKTFVFMRQWWGESLSKCDIPELMQRESWLDGVWLPFVRMSASSGVCAKAWRLAADAICASRETSPDEWRAILNRLEARVA